MVHSARVAAGAIGFGVLVGLVLVPSVPAGTVTSDTPVKAFTFLAPHPGRIFTTYDWGDYSIVRHRQTFVDGRTDLFTGPVFSEFFAVDNLTVNPDPSCSLPRPIRRLAVSKSLAQYLKSRPQLGDRRSHSTAALCLHAAPAPGFGDNRIGKSFARADANLGDERHLADHASGQ